MNYTIEGNKVIKRDGKAKPEQCSTLGAQISGYRMLRKLSQRELGELSGLPATTADSRMAQYENNKRIPSAEVLEDIAKALGISRKSLYATNLTDKEQMFHILFDLENIYGFQPIVKDGRCYIDCGNSEEFMQIFEAWMEKKQVLDEVGFKLWKATWPMDDDFVKKSAERRIKLLEEEIQKLKESIETEKVAEPEYIQVPALEGGVANG